MADVFDSMGRYLSMQWLCVARWLSRHFLFLRCSSSWLYFGILSFSGLPHDKSYTMPTSISRGCHAKGYCAEFYMYGVLRLNSFPELSRSSSSRTTAPGHSLDNITFFVIYHHDKTTSTFFDAESVSHTPSLHKCHGVLNSTL